MQATNSAVQIVRKDSLVNTPDGSGRVVDVAILYQENQQPKTGINVYLLQMGRIEVYSVTEIVLLGRGNCDHSKLAFSAMAEA